MVVLVDERPEDVTEMQRTVKGEVIAATFDRPAEDQTTVADLAVERAKRLVELGYDVVILLDSITRLGRAYNQTGHQSGRQLVAGIDVGALLPAKQFFGAARNIENGGSLTILAAAHIETGSAADEAILAEFSGAANLDLVLSGALADKRIFPAIDITRSGTRREEMLMGPDEVKVTWQLRRAIANHTPQEALDVVTSQAARDADERRVPGPDAEVAAEREVTQDLSADFASVQPLVAEHADLEQQLADPDAARRRRPGEEGRAPVRRAGADRRRVGHVPAAPRRPRGRPRARGGGRRPSPRRSPSSRPRRPRRPSACAGC